jgi:hypothetical protein
MAQKKNIRERKAEVDDREGRQQRDGDLADGDDQRHDQADHHHRPTGALEPLPPPVPAQAAV